MANLESIDFWKKNYGLLPIHLSPEKEDKRFLMLNGGVADFCFQTFNEEDKQNLYETSWSTNTKNYLVLENENLKIFNWFNNSYEEISKSQVVSNSTKFYSYLISKSFKSQSDIVPFIIDIFRQLRNLTLEKENPTDALNLLYLLLVSIEEDFSQIDYTKWGFTVKSIPDQFDFFVETIRNGVKSIKPNLDLILRHTSGVLFQEAHREVISFSPQRDLFGGVSSKLITKTDLYSSIHYTPQYIARTIVENSLKEINLFKNEIKILDPSCGSSEFLVETLKQLREFNYSGKIQIRGFDISESAVNTSKFLLEYENRTQWDGRLDIEIIKVEDSLKEDWGNDNDLILMNPPFVSWELIKNKEERNIVLETLGNSFKKGKPNQATAFFYKSKNSLGEDGILGCVLPSSIFQNESYNILRNEVQEELSIKLLAKLGNFVFEDALTDVSLFIGKKPKNPFNPQIIWTKNEKGIAQDALRDLRKINYNNEHSLKEKNYSIYTPSKFPIFKDSWKIISLDENEFIKNVERFVQYGKLSTVSKLFTVKQGIRQGLKDVFKISKDYYLGLNINEKKLFRPVVDNSTLKRGVLSDTTYIWYPYDTNGMILKSERDLENLYFYEDRIKPNEYSLKNRAGIKEWWGHTRARNWQFEKVSKLVSTEFGKSDSFAFDSLGDFVVERGNAWFPKRKMNEDDLFFYLSVFSSSIFDNFLSIFSKSIMSGYYLGQTYTKDIPIPDVSKINTLSNEYITLVELGKELSKGNSLAKFSIDEILTTYFYPKF